MTALAAGPPVSTKFEPALQPDSVSEDIQLSTSPTLAFVPSTKGPPSGGSGPPSSKNPPSGKPGPPSLRRPPSGRPIGGPPSCELPGNPASTTVPRLRGQEWPTRGLPSVAVFPRALMSLRCGSRAVVPPPEGHHSWDRAARGHRCARSRDRRPRRRSFAPRRMDNATLLVITDQTPPPSARITGGIVLARSPRCACERNSSPKAGTRRDVARDHQPNWSTLA